MERNRYELKDIIHVTSLDTALTMFEQLSDLPPKEKGEDIFLYKYDEDGTELGKVKVTKTFTKVLHGFIQGTACELTRDGYGKSVRQVFDKHCAEREREGMNGTG